jgi:RNA polymerase sigma factor (sigma-70 family)
MIPSHTAPSVGLLYNDHHGWLKSWLRGKLGDACQAADLAHDTFVRVLRSQPAHEIREPRSYLSTIAHGLVVDLYRRRDLERAYLEALAHLPEAQVPSPEAQALLRETLLEIDAMLAGLGPRVRQAFLLSTFEGIGYDEIAGRLGVSLRTVKNHMAKAIEHCCLMRLAAAD